ncbi:helix-turn-helix domain-containing protein [Reinekea marina]|uniref:GlxA family transcriptional regulator n=1 Tax=Reinekea marina TaxID=1310421 RepID=A0ABV7WWJ5_9GAMM|nr:helix-turn-helix domain-containing protein [Reinekea marina]MDN3649745.1 helix-turn-helix domain-containing protein [Reinekea marina]
MCDLKSVDQGVLEILEKKEYAISDTQCLKTAIEMKVGFLLYPQVLATAVTVPVEMFQAADHVKNDQNTQFSAHFISNHTGPVTLTGGITLVATDAFETQSHFDWVFVPPMWGSPWHQLSQASEMHAWLANAYANGTKLIATGTGVGHLCSAGLLAGRVSTTHWYYLDRFQKRFPDVEFQKQHFITHQDGLYCAGSINAQTDLVLYFIERHWGEEALALVEQQFMHELKRSFTTPFYEPGGAMHNDELVSLAQSWMRTHLAEPISLKQLTEVVGQSERQFRRRFTSATGLAPLQYLTKIRMEYAQDLLRETNLSMAEVAFASGYTNNAYFSKAFKEHASVSPSDYRRIVRSKPFSG